MCYFLCYYSMSFINLYFSLDVSEIQATAFSAPRSLLDIELHCKDGVLMASSQILGSNSSVFEKMLFSVVQMVESKTSIIRFDDVLVAEMEFILKYYVPQRDYHTIVNGLSKESTMSAIAFAHRLDFAFALGFLCDHLLIEIPQPTPEELQFADRLNLHSVLLKWSLLCELPHYFHQFVRGLADFPLTKETTALFSDAHFTAQMIPKCMKLKLVNWWFGFV